MPGMAFGKLVRAFRQLLRERRQAPGRELFRVLHRRNDFEFAASRKNRGGISHLPVETVRLKQRAVFRGPLLQPGVKAVLVDEVDRPRFLIAVGHEERSEIGHLRPLAPHRPSIPPVQAAAAAIAAMASIESAWTRKKPKRTEATKFD